MPVVTIRPDGANTSTWTPSAGANWQCVDESVANDDTDYVSKASGDSYGVELYTATASGLASTVPIARVVVTVRLRKTSTARSDVAVRGLLWDSSTFAFPTEGMVVLANDTDYHDLEFTFEPINGPGGVLTPTLVDSMSIGFDHTTTGAGSTLGDGVRITQVFATVHYLEAMGDFAEGEAAAFAAHAVHLQRAETQASQVANIARAGNETIPADVRVYDWPEKRIRIEVYTGAGDKAAVAGPITDVLAFSYQLEVDRIGSFTATVPAMHPVASQLQTGYELRFTREGEGVVFIGTVDLLQWQPDEAGGVQLQISGASRGRELVWANVGFARVYAAADTDDVVTDLLDGTGWTASHVEFLEGAVNLRIDGATVFEALTRVAELLGMHVVLDPINRTVWVGFLGESSGLRFANYETPPVAPLATPVSVYPITDIQIGESGQDLWNRVYIVGAGDGWAQLPPDWGIFSSGYGLLWNPLPSYAESTYRSLVEDQVNFEGVWPPAGWAFSNCAASQSTTFAKAGTHSMKLIPSTAAAYDAHASGYTGTIGSPTGNGQQWSGGAWILGAATAIGKTIRLRVVESGGASGTAETYEDVVLTSAWQYVQVDHLVQQADRTLISLYFSSQGSEATSDNVYIDRVKLWCSISGRAGGVALGPSSPYMLEYEFDGNGVPIGYFEDSRSVVEHGLRERVLIAKDVYPLGGSVAEYRAASKMLFDLGASWLARHVDGLTPFDFETIGLAHYVAGVAQLTAGQTVNVRYLFLATDEDGSRRAYKTLEDDYYVLGFERSFDQDGGDRWRLACSNVDEREATDDDNAVSVLQSVSTLQKASKADRFVTSIALPATSLPNGGIVRLSYEFDPATIAIAKSAKLTFTMTGGSPSVGINYELAGLSFTPIASLGPYTVTGTSVTVDLSLYLFASFTPVLAYVSAGLNFVGFFNAGTTTTVEAVLTFEMSAAPNSQ